MANKKRIATSVAAVATAAALLLGGTFAWQSISQRALNEASDVINPGGRLHDDFNGSDKNVYVENFAEDEIFARVRFDEYMEIVINHGTPAEKTEKITPTATKTDVDTYVTHKFGETNATDDYWDWTMGSADSEPAYYMPTFNLNKDSLAADVNGVFNGANFTITDKDDGDQYASYVDYSVAENQTKEGYEIYDGDTNNVDELSRDLGVLKELTTAVNNIIDTGDITGYENNLELTDEMIPHTAALVNDQTGFMSMQEWIDEGSQKGPYWVYDTDGWCYWAQPIGKGETTGLLMDGIALDEVMDDTWYYAINVVGQFITADDIGDGTADNPGFMQDGMTDAAKELLRELGVDVEGAGEGDGELGYTETLPDINFINGAASATVYRGTSYTFGNVATGGFPVYPNAAEITTEGAASYVNDDMIIVIDETEPNDTLSMKVTYNGDGGEPYTETVTLTVLDPATPDSDETLQEAFNNGGKIDLGDEEIDAEAAEPIANVSADFFWTEGGTLNGGVINGTPSTAEDDSDSYTTLFINNEKDWPEEGDDANHATMNDTVVNSESDFAVYIQTVDAGATLNGVKINGKFGGLLAEYNTEGQHCVNLNDVTINAGSKHKTDWVNTAVAAAHDAIININGGSYTGKYAAYVFSSGGTINIYGGTFDGALRVDAGTINIYGGTFNVDPAAFVDTENYDVTNNNDGTWTVSEKVRGLYTLYLKDSEGNDYDSEHLMNTDGFVHKIKQSAGSTITVQAGYTANPNWELPEGVTVALAAYGLAEDGWDEENSSVTTEIVYTAENNPYIFSAETGVLADGSGNAVATIDNNGNTITLNKVVENLIVDVYLLKDGQRIESTGSSSDTDKLFNSRYFVVGVSGGDK